MRVLLLFFILCLTSCRTAPTRQELIDNAVSAKAATEASDEAQKELSVALDELQDAADEPQKLPAALKRAAKAVENAEAAAEQLKTALERTQKLLADSEAARLNEKARADRNETDARRWRIVMWVLVIGGPLLIGFAVWRRFA